MRPEFSSSGILADNALAVGSGFVGCRPFHQETGVRDWRAVLRALFIGYGLRC